MHYHQLSNGVEVVVKEDHFSSMVAIQCWVKAGSLHEGEHERGMAHLIEHMLFKGTSKRKVGEISQRIEACGGDINAYTTFDRTVFYLTLSSEHAEEGVAILADAIYNSSFDEQELAREKEVVLEEIRRGLDSPGQKVGRKLFEHVYKETEAGRPIIGSEASVKGFTRDDVVAFHERWYVPGNLSVVVVGDVDSEVLLDVIQREFGEKPSRAAPEFNFRANDFPADISIDLMKGDFKQPRLEFAFPGPELEHYDSVPLDLAAFALGSGDASRLMRRLRDKEKLVAGAGASLYSPGFRGLLSISTMPSHDTYLDTVKAIGRELSRLKSIEPVSDEEIDRARANLKVNRVYQEETVSGQARSVGYSLLTKYKTNFEDIYFAMVDRVTTDQVAGAVSRWIDPDRAVIVGLLPNDSQITKDDVLQAYQSGLGLGKSSSQTLTRRRSSPRTKQKMAPIVADVHPSLKLVYRHNPDAKLFAMTAVSAGGLRGETPKEAGLYHCLSGLIAKATRKNSYEELLGFMEGIGAGMDGFSGKDSYGLQLHCLTEHVPSVLGLMSESLAEPVFPDEQWQANRFEILQAIAAQQDQPAQICIRRFQELIYGSHPYHMPSYGREESIRSYTVDSLHSAFLDRRDAGPWCFAATGAMPPDQLLDLLREAFADFHPEITGRPLAGDATPMSGVQARDHIEKDREQTHVLIGFPGLTWKDSDRQAFDVMTAILGGMGGRLFSRLRDRNSLAYTVSPISTMGVQTGMFGCYIACSPNKTNQAIAELNEEMARLCESEVSAEELERAKKYVSGNHEAEYQRSESQAMTMALMELYGLGFDDFLKYPKLVGDVTGQDVLRVARRLIRPEAQVQVTVGQST